ncbi:hypothetical protein MAR_037993, partial [Mya arenaria]
MAQKYLMALDYMELHANTVLQKHAKKRPLGDIETKHRYTPTQPVLSCRTVDIDVSGTRTYRPKSSADIITPPRRSKTPRKSVEKNKDNTENKVEENSLKSSECNSNSLKSIEVQGRPLTSLSQRGGTKANIRTSTSNKRPKTTGNIKGPKVSNDNFMIVHADRELIETRRSYRSLTNKIHKHWEPESHDLNQGTYQRGKKPPGVPAVDSWLTFTGSQAEEANGVVDAFAEHVLEKFLEDSDDSSYEESKDVDTEGEYYNVEGTVGSRIAQQLQQGDRIRIGINGDVQTHDLKVKKWFREDSFVRSRDVEDKGKENMASSDNQIIPLSWDDQVSADNTKVITARQPRGDPSTMNLNETRPVVFTKLLPDDLTSASLNNRMGKQDSKFKVKQRRKNKPGMDGREQENKVTVVTIDARSEEEEKKIEKMTVDDVIKQNCAGKNVEKQNGHHEEGEKHSVTFSFPDNDPLQDGLYSQSKVSITDSYSSGMSDQKHPMVKPTQPTFGTKNKEVDLDIIGSLSVPNGQRPLSSEMEQPGSLFGIKNPNPAQLKRQQHDAMGLGHTSEGTRQTRTSSGIREPVPSPELENYEDFETKMDPTPPMVEIKPVSKAATPALSISIPTADYTDSAMNSPTRKQSGSPESSPQMRRAKDMRDEQIDQITSLL